jgi:hypothetical protein
MPGTRWRRLAGGACGRCRQLLEYREQTRHQQASRPAGQQDRQQQQRYEYQQYAQPFSAAAATSKSDPVPALDRGRGNTAHVRRPEGDGAFPLRAPASGVCARRRPIRATRMTQPQHHHPQARRSAWPASCLPGLLLRLRLLLLLRPAPRVSGARRDTAVQPNTCQSVSRPLQHALARRCIHASTLRIPLAIRLHNSHGDRQLPC